MLRLWRLYRYPPTQYLRCRLYRRDGRRIEDFVPIRILKRFQEACNKDLDPSSVEDKAAFARILDAEGLPVVRQLLLVKDGKILDGRDVPVSRDAAVAMLEEAGTVFVKPPLGQQGHGAFVWRKGMPAERILSLREALVQPMLRQHQDLSDLHPGSINTIRLDTLWTGVCAETSAAILRIGVGGSFADNTSMGGLLAPIDVAEGVVSGPAIHSSSHDPHLKPYSVHPDTGARIEGLRIPFWSDVLQAVKRGAGLLRPLRSLGWDVVIGPDGPLLLEGNHDWHMSTLQWDRPLGITPLGRAALRHHREGMLPPP
jgi:hypothetical protein